MPKTLLPVFAGALIAFSPALIRAQSQPTQGTPPAQSSPSSAAPAPALSPPAPAEAPTPLTYPKNPVRPTSESQTKAKTLYQIDCAMCHGDNGNGKSDLATSMELTLSDWTDPKTLAGRQDGELFAIIRNGKDKMPPEADGRASDEAVWNLVVYIRGFSKASGTAAAGAHN
jgi:mono/diheme cytochrome c family protein